MNQRAFTLLETLLAAALGSILVLVAAGLMWSIQSTDRRLEVRYRQLAELRGVRLTMERTLSSLLMSEQPVPSPPREQSNVSRWDYLKSLRLRESEEILPDRFRLRPGDSGVMPGVGVPVQRLEVVLTDPPVPSPKAQAAADAMVAQLLSASTSRRMSKKKERTPTGEAGKASGADRRRVGDGAIEPEPTDEEADFAVRATRGAFEVRPGILREGEEPALELWWVPLPRVGSTFDEQETGGLLDDPYRLAKELRLIRWRVFREREWTEMLEATWAEELPAYIEMEIETTGGLKAKWLFEVGYARGPELRRRTPAPDPNAPATPVDESGRPGQTPRPPAGGGK